MSVASESLDWTELAHRQNAGMDIALLWRSVRGTDTVRLIVDDNLNEASGDSLIPPESALDAFYHPGAYLGGIAVSEALGPETEAIES